MNEDDFYIGYLPKAPKNYRLILRLSIMLLLLLVIAVSYLVATNQKAFDKTTYEYGEFTELKGLVSMKPVPRIIVDKGIDVSGNRILQSILLVNFGKSGVQPIFNNLEKDSKLALEQYEFHLRGTLIYGEGKTVFEMTEQESAIISYQPLDKTYLPEKPALLGETTLYGEILDSKCYFGVMKPGYGKVHRSCAIRCVAGGITPVLLAKNDNGNNKYILLTDKKGGSLLPEIMSEIGKPIKVAGSLSQVGDWLLLELDKRVWSMQDHQPTRQSFARNNEFTSGSLKFSQYQIAKDIVICQ